MLTFQSIPNQSLQFALLFHLVLLSEMQTQPPGFLNMKDTLIPDQWQNAT